MPQRSRNTSPQTSGGEPPELVLAAVERAARHRPGRAGAPFWTILQHLHVPRRSAAARTVRASIESLTERGWLQVTPEHGIPLWRLSPSGRRRLRRAERSASPPALGESPQHEAWRTARTLAAAEIERFRAALAEDLARGQRMLEARDGPPSDDWLELGARLHGDCRRLGSAWHCLAEWEEPDDAVADVDTAAMPSTEDEGERERRLRALRAGRRNVRLWREPD